MRGTRILSAPKGRQAVACPLAFSPGAKPALCFTAPEPLLTRGFSRHGLTLYGPDEVRGLLLQGGRAAGAQTRAFWCATGEW